MFILMEIKTKQFVIIDAPWYKIWWFRWRLWLANKQERIYIPQFILKMRFKIDNYDEKKIRELIEKANKWIAKEWEELNPTYSKWKKKSNANTNGKR